MENESFSDFSSVENAEEFNPESNKLFYALRTLELCAKALQSKQNGKESESLEYAFTCTLISPSDPYYRCVHALLSMTVDPFESLKLCSQALEIEPNCNWAFGIRSQANRVIGNVLRAAEAENLGSKSVSTHSILEELRKRLNNEKAIELPTGISGTTLSLNQEKISFVEIVYEHQSKVDNVWQPSSPDKPIPGDNYGAYSRSNNDGKIDRSVVELPKGWIWNSEWELNKDSEGDDESWSYARSHLSIQGWHPCCLPSDQVRRRPWYRTRLLEIPALDVEPIVEFATKLSRSYPSEGRILVRRYENERRTMGVGEFSSKMLPGERPNFSSADGRVDRSEVNLPVGWKWVSDWTLVEEEGAGEDGWKYSINFADMTGWSASPSWMMMVRRRKQGRCREIESSSMKQTLGFYNELPVKAWLYLVNRGSELALKVPGSSKDPGALIMQSILKPRDNQVFRLLDAGMDNVYILVKHSGMALTEDPVTGVVTQQVLQYVPSQRWKLVYTECGYYRIFSRVTRRCLGVPTRTVDKHTRVTTYPYNVKDLRQQWMFVFNSKTTEIDLMSFGLSFNPPHNTRSMYMLVRLVVQHQFNPHTLLDIFPSSFLADILEVLLQSCVEQGGSYGRMLATHLYHKSKSAGPLRAKWCWMQSLRPKSWLQQVYQHILAPCACSLTLYTPQCAQCGESRENVFRIPDSSFLMGQIFASITETHIGASFACQFQHPLYPLRKVTKMTVVKQFSSNAKPYLLRLEDVENYDSSHVIFKTGDDLSQDAMVLTFFGIFNDIWASEGLVYEGEPVQTLQYRVVCTGPQQGLIEVVPDSKPLQAVRNELVYSPRLVATAAATMAAGYVLGVCDRHKSNMLLATDGTFFHIDFGHILGDHVTIDADVLAIPTEFRSAFGDKYPQFELLCAKAYSALTRESVVLKSLLRLFYPNGTPQGRNLSLDLTPEDFLELVRRAPDRWSTALKNKIHDIKFPTPKPEINQSKSLLSRLHSPLKQDVNDGSRSPR